MSSMTPVNVLICDDSPMARKQMARALPPEWPVAVHFVEDGIQALEQIRAGAVDVLFLDLNMPLISGYEVLETIHVEDLHCLVLVVSGDVQPQARQRARDKGALDFIGKPVDCDQIRDILTRFGLLTTGTASDQPTQSIDEPPAPGFLDVIREVVNVAMGQAGGRLGEVLDTFITLPIPQVHRSSCRQLPDQLAFRDDRALHAVSQGFSARGVSGEAILLMKHDDLERLRLPYESSIVPAGDSETVQEDRLLSALVDVCGLLAGSCLHGISEQLDLEFNHSYPVVLGNNRDLNALFGTSPEDQEVLAVEICYRLEGDVACDLVLAFTENSIPVLEQRATLLQQESEAERMEQLLREGT